MRALSAACLAILFLGMVHLNGGKRVMMDQVVGHQMVLGKQVGEMMRQVMVNYLAHCHVVLASWNSSATVIQDTLSVLEEVPWRGIVVVDVQTLKTSDVPKAFMGSALSPCRAIIFDLINDVDNLALRFLEASGAWERSETKIVVVGGSQDRGVRRILLHHDLRNTIHAIYLALDPFTTHALRQTFQVEDYDTGLRSSQEKQQQLPQKTQEQQKKQHSIAEAAVTVYWRCMYCDGGEAGVRILNTWSLASPNVTQQLFPEQFKDLMGHRFDIVTMTNPPYIDYDRDTDDYGTTVTLTDSLDTRMLLTMATHLNFTYDLWEPMDRKWGNAIGNGNWTGIVGTLQYHKAEFSTNLTPTPGRMMVIEHSRIYIDESTVVLSVKPQKMPPYLSIVRPFPGTIWILVLLSVVVIGLMLWLLQWAWSWASNDPEKMTINTAMTYTWGTLLENPPSVPPTTNISGQVLVGWWLIYCLVVACAYRSSLVAHLTTPEIAPAIDSFHDLAARPGWRWGATPDFESGAMHAFHIQDPDPSVQKVFNNYEIHEQNEQLGLVLQGGYSYISHMYEIRTLIAKHPTSKFGQTPFHIGRTAYPLYAGNSWGFRRGSPIRHVIGDLKQRMLESGLIRHWFDAVFRGFSQKRYEKEEEQKRQKQTVQEEGKDTTGKHTSEDQVVKQEDDVTVLTVSHLQSAFILLSLGYSCALLSLLLELVIKPRQSQMTTPLRMFQNRRPNTAQMY